MKSINNFIKSFNSIILINDSLYIGDSAIFFWPLINTFVSKFSNKNIVVFHNHINLFKPIKPKVLSFNLKYFYDFEFEKQNTLVIAVTSKKGLLKFFLQENGYQSIVKDFVGFNFITLNISEPICSTNGLESVSKGKFETDYIPKSMKIHSESGFPMLDVSFENVYEYSKIRNEIFWSFYSMDIAQKGNIILHNFKLKDSISEMFVSHVKNVDRSFVLINLICGTFKEDVPQKYNNLLRWIKKLSADNENFNVFILSDSKFPTIRNDLKDFKKNIFFLKRQTNFYWTTLIKNADKVYSIDTGFLHVSHILNKNTFGFGGNVDFWFFKDKIIRIEDY